MTSVVRLRAFANSASVPLLTLVDMQQESLAEPRLLALSGAGAALANCRKVFDHAHLDQACRWPSCPWSGNPPSSIAPAPFIRWIDGLSPIATK
jgi:hypothetical protein